MRKQSAMLTVMSVFVLLITSSLALYYRNQAVYFQREYSAAVVRLGRVSAAPRWEVTKTPAAPRDADAGNRPLSRREIVPQVAEQDNLAPIASRRLQSRRFPRELPNRSGRDVVLQTGWEIFRLTIPSDTRIFSNDAKRCKRTCRTPGVKRPITS